MAADGEIDWDKVAETTRIGIHFLDNVIDANKFPLPEIEKTTKGNRKIGLGVMGWADLLIRLGIPYNSEEALNLGEKLMKFIAEEARKESVRIAETRGAFPNFSHSLWATRGYKVLRNSTLTTVAPTGTISIIAGVTSGIEPLFAVSYVRNVMEGTRLIEVNSQFEMAARREGFYSKELMMEVAKRGSVKNMSGVPEDVQRVFVTAFDIDPEWHVRMQAAFQKYIDNAVSKTVNLPAEASLEDVRKIYLLAYKLKCKGVTVYRYGTKREQVLGIAPMAVGEESLTADSEYAGGCPAVSCPY
jgi:ribonucleoside-diphosphate reductase alpha chain